MRGAGILPAIFNSWPLASENRRRDAGATGRCHSGTLSLHLRFREVADGLIYEARVVSPATSV
jgi:hypothetical protein